MSAAWQQSLDATVGGLEPDIIALRRHLHAQVGKTLRVLTEYAPIGHTEQFTAVRFASAPIPGRIIDVHIAGHDGRRLIAA